MRQRTTHSTILVSPCCFQALHSSVCHKREFQETNLCRNPKAIWSVTAVLTAFPFFLQDERVGDCFVQISMMPCIYSGQIVIIIIFTSPIFCCTIEDHWLSNISKATESGNGYSGKCSLCSECRFLSLTPVNPMLLGEKLLRSRQNSLFNISSPHYYRLECWIFQSKVIHQVVCFDKKSITLRAVSFLSAFRVLRAASWEP